MRPIAWASGVIVAACITLSVLSLFALFYAYMVGLYSLGHEFFTTPIFR